MDVEKRISTLLELFISLRKVLLKENENNWIRGIDSICNALTPPFEDKTVANEALQYAEATYRSMMGGNGTFSDFHIWRDDFNERIEANRKLTRVKEDIWNIISA